MANHLYLNYYVDRNSSRRAELHDCFERNARNPEFDAVYCLTSDPLPPGLPAKVNKVAFGGRPTFADVFRAAGEHSGGGDLVVVANTDILFAPTAVVRAARALRAGVAYAITWWETDDRGRQTLYPRGDNQDVWMFRGPPRAVAADFPLGRLGCDNRLAWELKRAGYALRNPARSVRCVHVHRSGVRNYREHSDPVVPGPYLAVLPRRLGGFPPAGWLSHTRPISADGVYVPSLRERILMRAIAVRRRFPW